MKRSKEKVASILIWLLQWHRHKSAMLSLLIEVKSKLIVCSQEAQSIKIIHGISQPTISTGFCVASIMAIHTAQLGGMEVGQT